MTSKIPTREIVILGVCAAIIIAAQVALAALPNIELVSLLVILYTRRFKGRALFVIYIFALAEGVIYGFHLWWVCYLYVWTVLHFVARAIGGEDSPLLWAAVAGVFGLVFGALCSIPYFFTLGIEGGIAYFLSGVVFDLVHCAGNFVLTLLLYRPLDAVLVRALEGSTQRE